MNTSSNLKNPRCVECGSNLVLVEEKTEKVENYAFPITITTFRCSDDSCQAEIDKKTEARMKIREQQEKDRKIREQNRLNRIHLKSRTPKSV